MKKYTINIQAPENKDLDKVRVYLGRVDNGEDVFSDEYVVYEGELVSSFSVTEYTEGLNFYAADYFNDEGEFSRARFAKSVYLINDALHWDHLPEDKRYSTVDHRAAVFRPLAAEIPELATWMYKFTNAFWPVVSKFNLSNITGYRNQSVVTDAPVIVNRKGDVYAVVIPFIDMSLTANQRRRFVYDIKKQSRAERRVTIDGLVWEVDIPDAETAMLIAELFVTQRTSNINNWGRIPTTHSLIGSTTHSYTTSIIVSMDKDQEIALEGIPDNPPDSALSKVMINTIGGYDSYSTTPRLFMNVAETSGSTSPIVVAKYIGREGEVFDEEVDEVIPESEV